MEPNATNEDLVRRFCDAFSRRDVDEIVGFFADDAVYHNIPLAPAQGKDAIRTTLDTFVPGSPEIEFVMLNVASSGSVVFTERIDKMTFGGRRVELPVAGVFEIANGKIQAWRDYFDLQQFMNPPEG
jgi:limonene-1,2-epoxide hydrolase